MIAHMFCRTHLQVFPGTQLVLTACENDLLITRALIQYLQVPSADGK
jgi:hypothetical protein